MFKKVFFAAAIMLVSSPFVSAQDLLWSFSDTSLQTTDTVDAGTSGTAFLFSTVGFDFDAIQLGFTASGGGVNFTSGTAEDPETAVFGGTRYNRAESVPGSGNFDLQTALVSIDASGTSGELFGVNVTENGVSATGATIIGGAAIDPTFRGDASFGATGAFLLGSVNYDAVAAGTSEFTLFFEPAPDGLGIADTAGNNFRDTATLGTATLTVEPVVVPEPSSAMLLILGAAGMVARRRRS